VLIALFLLRGLLASGMTQTARGMVDNLLHLVQEYGFVPNGEGLLL
jgi:alpha,alpha-trehalase